MSTPPRERSPSARADLEDLAAKTIRVLAAEAVQRANSGHPGLPMGCAEIACALFTRFLKFDPNAPDWPDRDRFVLSAGHGSMLIYLALHLAGYDVSLEDLRRFRQLGSKTPGHPEHGDTPGVETTTGPLGQGFANAVGMALAEALLAARYNTGEHTVVNHHTYVLASDGDLMEGISHEAASLAGHLRLGKLIALYDDNLISLDGPTELAFSEDVPRRFDAYGWHTQRVDGHDLDAISRALEAARAEVSRPSLIACRTIIAKGSPNKAGSSKAHGSPLGEEEVELTRKALGWTRPPFTVPEEARQLFREAAARGAAARAAWEGALASWESARPEEAREWRRTQARELPAGWKSRLPAFSSAEKPIATRAASGKVINALASVLPELIGGSADLKSSNNTEVEGKPAIAAERFDARNIWFGVREHAMGAILNGMSVHGGIRPYGGTFAVFSDYARPAIRLAALMRQPIIYILTHDSIFLGEDGPTHQPIEHLAALRAIPNLWVLRPADASETAAAWALALERTSGPSALILSRQNLPVLGATGLGRGTERGGYVIDDSSGEPDLILLATGSEVSLALGAAKILRGKGTAVRVVNLPCWELFDAQPEAYRRSVLPPHVRKRLAVEAASPFGWERYVGTEGRVHGIDRFGASAPLQDLAEQFGFTPEAVAAAAARYLEE
jgi:transketolase